VDDIRLLGDGNTIARAYVDAGPVPERELAQRAGLGWIGHNSMLINPKRGSYHFLAVVLTNLDVALDTPFSEDRCGSCRRCIEACPTGAIVADRLIDSRLCISYLTIEYGGGIEAELQHQMGDWIFGCDECQNVCPWNVKFAESADDPILALSPSRAEESLVDLVEITAEQFQRRFASSALARPGLAGIRRNARIALLNTVARGSAKPDSEVNSAG
jgi:epoxyqueuosine reductase